jgi:small subunit ribosomal protein S20
VAQHKSAVIRIRRNDRVRVRNRQYLSAVKSAVKKFRAAAVGAATGTFDKTQLRPLFESAQSLLGRAGSKGLLHSNNVARKIGRLSAILRSAEAGKVAAADHKAVKKSAAQRRAESTAAAPAETKAAGKATAAKATAAKGKTAAKPAAKAKPAAAAKKPAAAPKKKK